MGFEASGSREVGLGLGDGRLAGAVQGPPGFAGVSGAFIQGIFEQKMLEPWARLKFHAGWSGWTRPPTMAGGVVCL